MRKFCVLGVLLLVVFSCKKDKTEVDDQSNQASSITTDEWAKKTDLNLKAKVIVEKWPEFNAMETSFDGLYQVENTEELSLILDDLIEKQKLLSDSKYPAEFDKPQVKSRQKVLKTYILKTKNDLEYQLDVSKTISELMDAHNAFLNQFNVLMNNKLPDEILFEE